MLRGLGGPLKTTSLHNVYYTSLLKTRKNTFIRGNSRNRCFPRPWKRPDTRSGAEIAGPGRGTPPEEGNPERNGALRLRTREKAV